MLQFSSMYLVSKQSRLWCYAWQRIYYFYLRYEIVIVKKTCEQQQQQQHPFLWHPGWPVLAIVALIRFRHFFRSYAFSLLKPYRSKSFFTHCSHDFLGRPFFLFPVISTSIISHIWELMYPRMTWPYYRRRLSIIISSMFTATLIYHEKHQSTRYKPVPLHTSSWSYDASPHTISSHSQH